MTQQLGIKCPSVGRHHFTFQQIMQFCKATNSVVTMSSFLEIT